MMEKDFYTFEDLVEIVAALRRGCPWDRVHTAIYMDYGNVKINFVHTNTIE